jgi:ElaB/YqjD/DUF883 family membrane-anchored ribosome-binding protein
MYAAHLRDESRTKLVNDVKAVVADAEAYLAASVGQTGADYTVARVKLERTVGAAKAQVAEWGHALAEKTRAAALATDGYVHEKPWQVDCLGKRGRVAVGALACSSLKRAKARLPTGRRAPRG